MSVNYSSVEAALDGWSMQRTIPGFVAGVTDTDGIAFSYSKGSDPALAGLGLDSIFWIASMTKAVTSVTALQLVDAGLLHLDDPLGDLLPEIDRRLVMTESRDDGTFLARAMRGRITLTHLCPTRPAFWGSAGIAVLTNIRRRQTFRLWSRGKQEATISR